MMFWNTDSNPSLMSHELGINKPAKTSFIRLKTVVWNIILNSVQYAVTTILNIFYFRFGRRYPLIVAVLVQVSAGIGAAYIAHYWWFTLVRFFVGASVGGTMVVGFVIIMEFVGNEHRDIVSALYQTPFNTGHILVAVFGYYFRDYSNFQLAISLPALALLSYIFFMPESPRWLIAVKKTDEAINLMERIAKM